MNEVSMNIANYQMNVFQTLDLSDEALGTWLSTPPRFTTVRFNTEKAKNPEEIVNEHLQKVMTVKL